MFTLRPYQLADCNEAERLLSEHGSAIGIAATGLGKGIVIAELARRYVENGKRVLVLADMGVLVDQLAETIEKHVGFKPGIERASESSDPTLYGRTDRIVVGTVQTQFAERNGRSRYEKFEPGEFGLIIVDECEAYLAPKYREVLGHHLSAGGHLFGCTATPMRGDNSSMGQLFDAVAFKRDIRWGVREGYLVPPRQGFVHVNVDFKRLKVSGDDYTDKSVTAMLKDIDEQDGLKFASGIVDLSGDKQGIVVASSIATAEAISEYINAVSPGMARAVHGSMDGVNDAKDTLYAFKHNHFQILCSVNMLTKGFDHAGVHNIFMCRPTKSKRLYTQVLGRGVRLADPAIGNLVDADSRRDAISASDKPRMTMYNMVGIDADVRDLTIGDVLGGDMTPRQREAVYQAVNDADEDILDAVDEALEEGAAADAEAAESLRLLVQARAQVEVEFADALSAISSPEFHKRPALPDDAIKPSTRVTLKRFRIPAHIIARLTPVEAGKLAQDCMRRMKAGLCSINQAAVLKKMGYEVERMTKKEASEILSRRR